MMYVVPVNDNARDLSKVVCLIVIKREHLKRAKDYKKCDVIRDFLTSIDVEIQDINLDDDMEEIYIKNGWKSGDFLGTNYDVKTDGSDKYDMKVKTAKAQAMLAPLSDEE